MRLTLDVLGHRIEFSIDHPADDTETEREGAADALVERSDPYSPPIGFYPNARPEETL